MSDGAQEILIGQLERELAYYRRECNDLGARLLRLQEEQSQTFREARRSRTVAKLIREAYRLADGDWTPNEIGVPMLEIIIENALCDGAALLREDAGGECFRVMHAIGAGAEDVSKPGNINWASCSPVTRRRASSRVMVPSSTSWAAITNAAAGVRLPTRVCSIHSLPFSMVNSMSHRSR